MISEGITNPLYLKNDIWTNYEVLVPKNVYNVNYVWYNYKIILIHCTYKTNNVNDIWTNYKATIFYLEFFNLNDV